MLLKFKYIIVPFLVIIFLLSLCSCAPIIVIKPEPPGNVKKDPFSDAENSYKAGLYEQALKKYMDYLILFPGSSLAPAALMKIASIYTLKGYLDKARDAYEKVITRYSGSIFVPDAGVEILEVLLREGKYDELIQKAGQLPKHAMSRIQILRTSMLVGDSFFALGNWQEAAYSYLMAHSQANSLEKDKIEEKLKQTLEKMDEPAKDILIARLKDQKYISIVKGFSEKKLSETENIGCLLPLSGKYKEFGNRALKGIELALNKFGVQNGQPFKIIVKDTESDPKRGAALVKELVNEKAGCIIGPMDAALDAAKEAELQKIPIITLSQQDNIPEVGDFVFRNFLTPRMQVSALVSYAINNLLVDRFAILYPREKYGTTYMTMFADEVTKKNGRIVAAETYEPGQTDFTDCIKKLADPVFNVQSAQEQKTIIFIPDSARKAEIIIPQIAYYNIENIYFFGTNLWHSNELIKTAGQFVQGAVIAEGFFEESVSPKLIEFIAEFKKTYNETPGFIEAVAYDTACLLLQVLAVPEVKLRSDIKDALLTMNPFEGVTGLTSFDSNGEALKTLFLLRIQGDKFVEIDQN